MDTSTTSQEVDPCWDAGGSSRPTRSSAASSMSVWKTRELPGLAYHRGGGQTDERESLQEEADQLVTRGSRPAYIGMVVVGGDWVDYL